jgi:tRNA-splicing ligase RtcB
MRLNSRAFEVRSRNGAVPIRHFTGADLLPDEPARMQLLKLAALPGLSEYVVVLPDVHFKSRNPTPTGTVMVTRDLLVPRAVDQGINCGMRMVATSVPARELTAPMLDRLYGRLIDAIPLAPHAQALLSDDACEHLLVHGLGAVAGPLELTPADLARTENGGGMNPVIAPEAIRAIVTKKAIRKGNPWLGTLGAGNHFLELQEITEILQPESAARLGLEKGHAVFMMHTDSRKLGKQIMKPLWQEAQETLCSFSPFDGLWTTPADSEFGRRYLAALAAATHAGFGNRAALTTLLRRAFREVVGDASLALPLLYDSGHESIQREHHRGEWYWVHRHGASSALPPGRPTRDPVLAGLGQPVPIPGNMGSASYIGLAQPGVADTFHSVAHGAGRVMEKVRAAETFDPTEVEDVVRGQGVRLYRYGADNIAGQAPASFKDVHRVVDAMATLQLIEPVVRLRPIAVLKG